ncbi:hypothetical protein MPH_08065 [Macrophomina phaseolina MS6]|uniref:Uncharacterized protein n=1 Tax=Macrophomina phaseolina (strain MS6) TaxID=1126212 RepID=K2SD67_MACPH|nr:hypothetical protein MPH_08065 [Macrophomina phaseolina MS6]
MNLHDPAPPAPTNRKRSRSMIFEEDGEQEKQPQRWGNGTNGHTSGSTTAQTNGTEELKRTRTTGELDALGVIPSSEAWQLQGVTTDLLTAADAASAGGLRSYVSGRSLVVLCVLEHVDVQYHLLWYVLNATQ